MNKVAALDAGGQKLVPCAYCGQYATPGGPHSCRPPAVERLRAAANRVMSHHGKTGDPLWNELLAALRGF
jgi:hypothetical protein